MEFIDFNKNRKLTVTIGFYFFTIVTALSQTMVLDDNDISIGNRDIIGQYGRDIITPVPQVASIQKYDTPQPALATGSVDISIPIYELSYRGLSIPLTLRYNTTGYRLFDECYPYGHGWTLMPGLRITRTILGRPDERFRKADFGGLQPSLSPLQRAMSMRDEIKGYQYDQSNYNQYIDSQHDIYTLHLLDDHFNFMLDFEQTGVQVISGHLTTYRIETNPSLSFFDVTDGRGIKYHFGTSEYQGNNTTIGWLLSYITLPNGERISFSWMEMRFCPEYSYNTQMICDAYGDAFDLYQGGDCAAFDWNSGFDWDCINHQGTDRLSNFKQLQGIQTPTGNVQLYYSGTTNSYLDSIKVKNSLNKSVKDVYFEYDSVNIRIRLLQRIRTSDEGDYTFTYNRQNIHDVMSQDYWGFYNGHHGSYLNPEVKVRAKQDIMGELFNNGSNFTEIQGMDRSIDVDSMKANILTRIDYPTGGYSSFQYEPHQFNGEIYYTDEIQSLYNQPLHQGGGLRVKKIVTSSGGSNTPIITTYKYGNSENGLANSVAEPTIDTFIHWFRSFNYTSCVNLMNQSYLLTYRFRHIEAVDESQYLRWHLYETPIWYNQVTEYRQDGGKIVHTFDDCGNYNRVVKHWGYSQPERLSSIFTQGIHEIQQQIYDTDDSYHSYQMKRQIDYQFGHDYGGSIFDSFVHRNVEVGDIEGQLMSPDPTFGVSYGYNSNGSIVYYTNPFDISDCYSDDSYEIELIGDHLYQTQVSDVTDNGIYKKINRLYRNENGQIERMVSVSGDDTLSTQNIYPTNIELTTSVEQRAMLQRLLQDNIIETPYKTIINQNCMETISLTEYDEFHNMVLPWRELLIKGEDTCVVHEMDYDAWGNIISLTTLDDLDETFIWDSNGQYPLFHIVGINYNDLQQLQGFPPASLRDTTQLAATHAWLVQSLPRDCIVEAFQHEPLVGRKVSMDGNGHVTRYEYDTYGRLVEVSRDSYGILNKYRYHRFDEP